MPFVEKLFHMLVFAILKLFLFTQDEGKQLTEETVENLQPLLSDHSTQVSKPNEEKVWSFLETRFEITI